MTLTRSLAVLFLVASLCGAAAAQARGAQDDETIFVAVEQALQDARSLPAARITVQSRDGFVTLGGFAGFGGGDRRRGPGRLARARRDRRAQRDPHPPTAPPAPETPDTITSKAGHAMQRNSLPDAPHRAPSGAFHDYVRGVFAERSDGASRLRAARARWLAMVGHRAASPPAEQRWEGEGGSTG